jgi:hypothetical protein
MRLPVFFPHQLQGQMTMLLQLLMNGIPIPELSLSQIGRFSATSNSKKVGRG